jgi:flagella basal body P-ring formation protein FlgA
MGITSSVSFTGNEKVKVLGGDGRGRPRSLEMEDGRFSLASLGDFPAPGLDRPASADSATRAWADGGQPGRPASAGQSVSILDELRPELKERLAGLVSDYLAGQYSRPDVEIQTSLVSLSAPIPFSAREITVEEASGKIPGRASLRLSVRETPDSRPSLVTLSAEADISALALVAARPLAKGEILSSRDVKVGRVKMASGNSYLPPRPAAADGLELSRHLVAGEAVLAGDVSQPPAVRRGDLVQSVTKSSSRNGVWTVSASGKALGGGMPGDVITVEDPSTKAKYQARITGRGTVSVLPKRN